MADIVLNPVTRARMIYIMIFLVLDAAVGFVVGVTSQPGSDIPLLAVLWGFVNVAAAATVGSILYATRDKVVDLKAARSRE